MKFIIIFLFSLSLFAQNYEYNYKYYSDKQVELSTKDFNVDVNYSELLEATLSFTKYIKNVTDAAWYQKFLALYIRYTDLGIRALEQKSVNNNELIELRKVFDKNDLNRDVETMQYKRVYKWASIQQMKNDILQEKTLDAKDASLEMLEKIIFDYDKIILFNKVRFDKTEWGIK